MSRRQQTQRRTWKRNEGKGDEKMVKEETGGRKKRGE